MSGWQPCDDCGAVSFTSFRANSLPFWGLLIRFLSCIRSAQVELPTQLERTALTRQKEKTFWSDRKLELSSLQALLRKHRPLPKEFVTLMRCRTRENEHAMICENCGQPHVFDYHCNKRFCPCCAWQLSCERRKVLESCAHLLRQPKHVVLTARNDEELRRMLLVVLAGVRKLRRRELMSQVRGGWCSFEITNEGRGWHVHAHLLIDAPYIPAPGLAREWASCVGQDFAIVKVKDAREKKYLAEVTKYTVKPSVFIKWEHEKRVEFVKSIRGKRMFFAFGHVAEASRNVRANIKESRGLHRTKCCVSELVTSVASLCNPKNLHKVKRSGAVTIK